MMESIGHMPLDAYAYPAQARKTGGGVADPDALVRDRQELAQDGPVDKFVPSSQEEDYGLYSKESLLNNGLKAGDSVNDLDEAESFAERLKGEDGEKGPKDPNELDEGDKQLIKRLEARDREVKSHEASHAAAAGEYAEGAPSYTYQMGPDGKMYAIGGELAVDVGKEATQAENMRKSHILQSAALGVDDPSVADSMVAMQASDLMGEGIQFQA